MGKLGENKFIQFISNNTDILIAVLILSIITLIVIPLPSFLLDLFLALNITLAVLILLLTIFSNSVLDFSIFPTLLLVTTLFRLALNISSTRLILSTGNPGSIVTAFGNFVTQGDIVVGAVIFIIICIVQFMVITNGSSRVAEVSARFTLDAMPGKQMSIDADLNAGLINESQAKKRREQIQVEAEFYGAMDGASKFVKGDAIAGIIVTLINFVGGIIIFSLKGYDIMDAIQKFGILTIGDGLVSQVPALLISVASGIIVTRTPSEDNLGVDLSRQLLSVPRAIALAAGVMFLFALIPGLPFIPFMGMATVTAIVAYVLFEGEKNQKLITISEVEEPLVEDSSIPIDDMTRYTHVEPFEIEFGYGLIPLVDQSNGNDVLERILQVRHQIAQELGVIVQPIRLRDNLQLSPNQYVIKIRGNSVGTGEIYPGHYLIMNPFGDEIDLEGIDTIEPSFGLKAKWVNEKLKSKAEALSYTTVDDLTVLITHLKEIIRLHSSELLGRNELKTALDKIKEEYPGFVDDIIPNIISLSDVLKVLKNLLKENVPIKDLFIILETLADFAHSTKDIEMLTEYVRHRLARTISSQYVNSQGTLEVMSLSPQLEEVIFSNLQRSFQGSFPALAPDVTTRIFQSIQANLDRAMMEQKSPVILASPKIRVAFRHLIEINFNHVPVLSLNDIPNNISIDVIGMVNINEI